MRQVRVKQSSMIQSKVTICSTFTMEMSLEMASFALIFRVRIMVFNATFNNISVILLLVLLVEETGVPGENHQPVASHWQTLSHDVVSSTPRHEGGSNFSGDRYWYLIFRSVEFYSHVLRNWIYSIPARNAMSFTIISLCSTQEKLSLIFNIDSCMMIFMLLHEARLVI